MQCNSASVHAPAQQAAVLQVTGSATFCLPSTLHRLNAHSSPSCTHPVICSLLADLLSRLRAKHEQLSHSAVLLVSPQCTGALVLKPFFPHMAVHLALPKAVTLAPRILHVPNSDKKASSCSKYELHPEPKLGAC